MPDLWGSLHWSLIPFVRKYQLKWERGNNGFHVRSELRNSSVFRLLLPWSKKELIHFTFCHLFTYFSLSHSSHLCVCLSVIRTCAQSHVFAMFGMEYLCTMQCLLSSVFFFLLHVKRYTINFSCSSYTLITWPNYKQQLITFFNPILAVQSCDLASVLPSRRSTMY